MRAARVSGDNRAREPAADILFHCRRRNGALLKRLRRALAGLAGNLPMMRQTVRALARGGFADALRMARTARLSPDLGTEKIVSSKYRFLCICIPKVASRSLMAALRNADPEAEVFYKMRIGEVYAVRPEAREYFSFAFVRHPFTRAFSLYWELLCSAAVYAAGYHRYRGRWNTFFFDPVAGRRVRLRPPLADLALPAHKERKRRMLFAKFYGLDRTNGFDDFCEWLATPWGSDTVADRHFLSQHMQIRLNGDRLPDFVGRFEQLDADIERIARRIGMPTPALPMLNTMAGWQSTPDELAAARSAISACLNDRNRKLLASRYAGDFALGGYSSRSC